MLMTTACLIPGSTSVSIPPRRRLGMVHLSPASSFQQRGIEWEVIQVKMDNAYVRIRYHIPTAKYDDACWCQYIHSILILLSGLSIPM